MSALLDSLYRLLKHLCQLEKLSCRALFIENAGHVAAALKSANPLAFEVGFKAFKLLQASNVLLESSTALTNCSALPLINEASNPYNLIHLVFSSFSAQFIVH